MKSFITQVYPKSHLYEFVKKAKIAVEFLTHIV